VPDIVKVGMVLKPADIEEILRLIDSSDFDHVRLQLGDTKLEWHRRGNESGESLSTPEVAGRDVKVDVAQPPAVSDGSTAVPAPMLGVFWHAPRPGDPPFVKLGDRVTPDKIIGIIEVMKLMNTVPAGVSGIVTEITAPNGNGVEYCQTLIRVRID
jgi:acetyl-CoA carboxylase biotin carboxyl carrier protein